VKFSPHDAAPGPLKVPDPFGAGWTFHCVRAEAELFAPWRPNAKLRHVQLQQLGAARRIRKITEDADKRLEAAVGTDEDSAIEEALEAAAVIPAEEMEIIDETNEAARAIFEAQPHDAAAVSRLLVGWEGVTDGEDGDGNPVPVPFSPEAALSLLACEPVGSVNLAVMNGAGPLLLNDGEWAGYTVGAALCHYLPRAIRTATEREVVEQAAKKAPSGEPRSSGRGSGTSRKRKETKRIGPGSGASK
jgi:hypothetical protein